MMNKPIKKQTLVAEIIALYCERRHSSKRGTLCTECAARSAFAQSRSGRCPRKAAFCNGCPTPCYGSKREDMRRVMKYAAPRMLLRNPAMVSRHAIHTITTKEKWKMKKLVNPLFLALGFIAFAIGTIGIVLPVLPTTPLK